MSATQKKNGAAAGLAGRVRWLGLGPGEPKAGAEEGGLRLSWAETEMS
jgi:hypothetical protein